MAEIELYRPSNGTEGGCFMSQWCAHCERDRPRREDPDQDGCDIVVMTFALNVSDPDYPKQWRKDGPSGPRCTAFVPEGGDTSLTPLDPAAVIRNLL